MGILKFFGLQRIKDANKPRVQEPIGDADYSTKKFNSDLARGFDMFKKHGIINIFDDGRGYELALSIKHLMILEEQKRLSEKIKINNTNDNGFDLITVSLNG